MPSTPELRKEMEKQKGEPMESGILQFFEREVAARCEEARQDGMQTSIYKTIYSNLRSKFGQNAVSDKLKKKLDDINYYPALEEIQLAILTTPSLDAFKRKVARIVNKHKDEIQELQR